MSARIAPQQWLAERYDGGVIRLYAPSRVPMLLLGFLLVAGLPVAAWFTLAPVTTVETRFVADIAGPAARAALAEVALRLAATNWVSTSLDGESLMVTVSDRDAAKAQMLARSASTAALDMALTANRDHTPAAPDLPHPPTPAPALPVPSAAVTERDRLRTSLDTADTRLAALSTALTSITRDIAAGARTTPDRKTGRETLDKATLALADLQLQRIQLQSRYQDDFPAVVVVDGQIRSVRALIADESRRIDAANRATPDPGDPILSAERDRLRAEQAQWLDRRTAIAGDLAIAGRLVSEEAKEPPPATPEPEPVVVVPPPPAPMLIAAATTVTSSPDIRWWALPVAAGLGLIALLGAWFGSLRRSRAIRAELVLRQLETLMLTPNPVLSGQHAEHLLHVRKEAALLLRTSHKSEPRDAMR